MFKKITTLLLMIIALSPLKAQERRIVASGDTFSVDLPDVSNRGSAFMYLWWFGDGGYEITQSDTITHTFHNDYLINTNYNKYITTLVSTEIYGKEEGRLKSIDINTPTPVTQPTTTALTKLLKPLNPTSYLFSVNYLDAVPGDTVYLATTYGLPYGDTVMGEQQMNFYLDFEGEDRDDFQYINDFDQNLSFLPNQEYPMAGNSDYRYRWRLHAWTFDYAVLPGEERTMLLPFKYTGSKTSGEVTYKMRFERIIDDSVQFETTGSGYLCFAKSHDPNRTNVSKEITSCTVGGENLGYRVDFRNTGEGPTSYVRLEVQIDEAHDLSTIEFTRLPRWFDTIVERPMFNCLRGNRKTASYQINHADNRVILEFHNLFLIGSLDTLINDPRRERDFVKFNVDVKEDYKIGNPIEASADIFFDKNPAVSTNEAVTTCPNPTISNPTPEIALTASIPVPSSLMASINGAIGAGDDKNDPTTSDDDLEDQLKIIYIKPIHFDVNDDKIRTDASKELDKVVEVMNEYPELIIELGSHTDCRGSKVYNMKLSDRRAKASAAYIKKRITNPERISGKGYGESMLLNTCACEGDAQSKCADNEHEMNRRTEFLVVSNGDGSAKEIIFRTD